MAIIFLQWVRPKVPRDVNSPNFITLSLSLVVSSFVSEDRPLHNVLTFIFRSLMEVPTVCFATFYSTVVLKVLLSVFLLPRRNRHLEPRFLILVTLSGYARRLVPNDRAFWVLGTTLALPCLWRPCPSVSVGMARRVNRSRAEANFCRDPPLPWVHFCSCWLHPTPRCQSPCRFFRAPTGFTAASSLGTSRCSDSDSICGPLLF
jgi:hypothetical protein